jgi:hypothetical protein
MTGGCGFFGSTGGGTGKSGNFIGSDSSLYTTPRKASGVAQTTGVGINRQDPPGRLAPVVVVLALSFESFLNLIRS